MFGLGDSNKSKLEENMDEIKQMVDGEKNPANRENQESQELQGGQRQPGNSSEDLSSSGFDQPNRSQNKPPERNEGSRETEKKLQEEIEKFEKDNSDQGSGATQDNTQEVQRDSPDTEPEVDEGRYSGQGQESGSSEKAVSADIPEPAKTRDLDVPEIEKGPLFITRRKFETATRLIYEMRSLSNEIESTVEAMEQDIQRDRQTEQQVQTILDEFEQDRKDVESIISPK